MIWFVIPARKGSKGLPLKNRLLLEKTLKTIPLHHHASTLVTSDDDIILDMSRKYGCLIQRRHPSLCSDEASIRDVLVDTAKFIKMDSADLVVLLYLTFPEREYEDIKKAIEFFNGASARSMLCRVDPETHPYLCLYEGQDGKGRQVIKHDKCRRQEYPSCFMVSHYIGIFVASELGLLNRNMYNDDTIFYPINSPLDIDTLEDFKKLGT